MTPKRTQQNPDEKITTFRMPTIDEILKNSTEYWAIFNKAWEFMKKFRFPSYSDAEYKEYMHSRIGVQKGIIRTKKRYIDHAIRSFVEEQKQSGRDQEEIHKELKGTEIKQLQERYKTLFSLMRGAAPEKKPGREALKKFKKAIEEQHALDDAKEVR